ncbi:MAG: HAD hydrolase-like protein, partial [Solirubrobacteraceae bacterium]|nr:HAD hydrolase-like protein [Solirubrobacteraceae bacterium]
MALGRLITLDALGTLVELEPPAPHLVAELGARGLDVSEEQAADALAEEIAYYRAHHDLGVDGPALALLRARCAEVLGAALVRAGADVSGLQPGALRDALLAALRFRAFGDVPAALTQLRAAGHRLVVVSNWDVSLHEMLRTTGLVALVDGAISSAEAGERKPAPGIFARALALAADATGDGDGSDPRDGALHVGDSLRFDVAGARAAGMRAVLIARDGAPGAVPADVVVLDSLAGLAAL